ncbi:hypothetical protein H2200_000551 [Cladophialophora chaetospira]|uniref:Uncharacterized protein n=1 Tax=Cladophialophora chaetospira TaxID=386627 RepID=A0AA38XP02_9EURO|nr:hypothetical protein H2200_000551 [Cladophialophora chaetospira]
MSLPISPQASSPSERVRENQAQHHPSEYRALQQSDRQTALSFDRLPSTSDRMLAQSAAHRPPCPNLEEEICPRADLAHGVYFCEATSKYSFSGHIDRQNCMQEEEITDFVLYSHPELYKKLGNMTIESSHLSFDERGASSDTDCSELHCDISAETSSMLVGAEQGPASPANEAESTDTDCPNEPDDDMPQAREHFSVR